jgi:5'-3' exonuclease
MKVHLIDGTYELFRAFFAVPPSTGPTGQEVGATRGLGRSLLRLLADPNVTHLACAFDHVIESFRNQLFAGYKTGAGIDPTLLSQFPLAEQMTQALGIVSWPMIEFEADDAIATFAARSVNDPRVDQVVICSPDKDFAQCVQGTRCVLLDRMRNIVIDEPGVQQKFGVSPASIPDWLGLVGDTADGIPGIARWGAKSAAQVLAVYQHIAQIPQRAADWQMRVRGADVLAQNLSEARDLALLYRKLAVLRVDAPLQEALPDLAWRGPDRAALAELALQLGDARISALADEAYVLKQKQIALTASSA